MSMREAWLLSVPLDAALLIALMIGLVTVNFLCSLGVRKLA